MKIVKIYINIYIYIYIIFNIKLTFVLFLVKTSMTKNL